MIDVFNFFSTLNGKETLKRALASDNTPYDVCSCLAYTNKTECPFEEDYGDCSGCLFTIAGVSAIQKIRGLWTDINMHNNYDYDWYWVNIRNTLSNTLYNLTRNWVFCREIAKQVREINSFHETIHLLEIIIGICDEIEEEKI